MPFDKIHRLGDRLRVLLPLENGGRLHAVLDELRNHCLQLRQRIRLMDTLPERLYVDARLLRLPADLR